MDNNYNQQTNVNSNQQGAPYQQGNSYQQGTPYQQTNPYMDNSYGNYGGSYNYGSNPEPQKAPNIFLQFALAFIPPQYGRLTKVKTGSMIGFVTLLTLIATIISFVSIVIILGPIKDSDWTNALPDFEISNGRLYMDEDFMYEDGPMLVFLTDSISGYTYDDASSLAESGYRNIVLAGRDRISIMQNGEYQQFDFKDLGTEIEISKDWIAESFMPFMMAMLALMYILFFVGRTFWYFFCAMLYFLFGMLIAQILHKKQSSGNLYRTAVYSKVLMFVVMAIFDAIPGVSFSVPVIVRIIITMIFMGFAIAKLPENN